MMDFQYYYNDQYMIDIGQDNKLMDWFLAQDNYAIMMLIEYLDRPNRTLFDLDLVYICVFVFKQIILIEIQSYSIDDRNVITKNQLPTFQQSCWLLLPLLMLHVKDF